MLSIAVNTIASPKNIQHPNTLFLHIAISLLVLYIVMEPDGGISPMK